VQGASAEVSLASPAPAALRLRIAEIDLQIASADAALLEELDGRYGDCRAHANAEPGLRCDATRTRDGAFLQLEFAGKGLPDPFDSATTPFLVLRHLQGRVVHDRPEPGWRALVREGDPAHVLLAGDATHLLVRLDDKTRDLAVDCLIALALRAQPHLLFLHAASFAIAGRGALLVGPAKSGKSSTVLALASRGHDFLGDDLAPVRPASAELLPFPKSAGLRESRQATELIGRARAFRAVPGTGIDGIPRSYARVGDMFPASRGGPRVLDSVFLLDGFAQQASLRPYRPHLKDVQRLRAAVSESVPGWGHSAGEDLLKFLRVIDLLSQARCYLLSVGSLDQTATLIEQAMGSP